MLVSGFTRKEAIDLTGLTGHQLDYLAKEGTVVPKKYTKSKKPLVIYSWQQVKELKIIANLKQKKMPNRLIIEALEVLRNIFETDPHPFNDKWLILTEETDVAIKSKSSFFKRLRVVGNRPVEGKRNLQFLVLDKEEFKNLMNELIDDSVYISPTVDVLPPIGDIISQLTKSAELHNIIDFPKRAELI